MFFFLKNKLIFDNPSFFPSEVHIQIKCNQCITELKHDFFFLLAARKPTHKIKEGQLRMKQSSVYIAVNNGGGYLQS